MLHARSTITPALVERFLGGVSGQPLREGTRFARQARVAPFIGSGESVFTVVRGRTDDYDVALWSEKGVLQHHCQCPSWREPCKHEVAAALVVRQWLTRDVETGTAEVAPGAPDRARTEAIEAVTIAARALLDPVLAVQAWMEIGDRNTVGARRSSFRLTPQPGHAWTRRTRQ